MPIHFSVFERHPEIIYGCSERKDGPMKAKRPSEMDTQQRAQFFNRSNIHLNQVVAGHLVHGTHVAKVRSHDAGRLIPDTDGLFTDDREIFLSITAADCFPIYVFDPVQRVVALVHAGWRGVVDGIAAELVSVMQQDASSRPSDLLIGIGPGLRRCHFCIQDDIHDRFAPRFIEKREGEEFVDLPALIKDQFIARGVSLSHLEDVNQCTFCLSEQYFSYRRDHPHEVEAMVAYIGLRNV